MKSARNQLVLLGLLCQSLSWDGYYLAIASLLLWVLCLKLPRHPIRFSEMTECFMVALGCLLGYGLGLVFHQSNHFVIGHGITLLQAVRLLRPLDRREKIFQIIAACMQLAVGCTIILDIRFVFILLGAVVLIPRAFMEVEAEPFAEAAAPRQFPFKPIFYLVVIAASLVFFTVFPRSLLGRAFQNPGAGEGQGSLMDSIIDPTSGGSAQSGRVLLQIQGQNLGYLRAFTLIDFDGQQWTPDSRPPLRIVRSVEPKELVNYPHRQVRIKDVSFLGRGLPVDGRVVSLAGGFFRRPFQNWHGNIECEAMWNTRDNLYDYWIDPHPEAEPLPDRYAQRLVAYPPQTVRLRQWLAQELAGVTDPLAQAHRLETYFRDNFTYRIGAPKLSRLNTADDFIFNQKEGHCERFATTLALLLRMQNIPSRVVVGYVPGQRNLYSGWFNVRFKDAHAWTEGYFPQVGWVQLDATPRGSYQPSIWNLGDWFEIVDSAWNVYVVNFDTPTQRELLTNSTEALVGLLNWAKRNAAIGFGLMLAILFLVTWRKLRSGTPELAAANPARKRAQILAEHYYGRMLQALAKRGYHREPQQTPLEFVRALPVQAQSVVREIELITGLFCATRYGNAAISAAQQVEIEEALKRIQGAEFDGRAT